MKLLRTPLITLALTWAASTAAWAGDAGTAYTQLSTNGLGLGYANSVAPDWALRGQYNSYNRSFSGDVGNFGSNAQLQLDLNLNSLALLADWYPSTSGFRLTVGGVVNQNKVTFSGTNAVVGTASSVNVSGTIKFSDGMSPYLGLGYATRPKEASGFGFNFDLGVMLQNPSVSLSAPGVSQADIDAQKRKVEDAVDVLKNMPVLGIGLSYSF